MCEQQNIFSSSKSCLMAFVSIFCLSVSSASFAEDENPDPWEGLNRKIYSFNEFFDKYLLKPVAKAYDWVLPEPVNKGVTNVFGNLSETKNFLNDVLQLKFRDATDDAGRFLVNTTFGVVGLFDVASRWGIEKNEEDFGQTLAVWGVNSGPYVVLPFLGPSTVRDGVGLIPDYYSVPQAYIDHTRTKNTVYGVDFVDQRADLLKAEELIGGDKYLFIRDVYLQRREFLATDGAAEDDFTSEDFEDE